MEVHQHSKSEILHDFSPRIKVYKNGVVERLYQDEVVPPSYDRKHGVHSKDVVIPSTTLSARIYLPDNVSEMTKLPLLIYVHGGAFCMYSSSSSIYHNYLNSLVAESNVVAVSPNYRLAPEFPIPACYDDSWAVAQWATAQSDPWLARHADVTRVYFAGDSAGANIAHEMVTRAGLKSLSPARVTAESAGANIAHQMVTQAGAALSFSPAQVTGNSAGANIAHQMVTRAGDSAGGNIAHQMVTRAGLGLSSARVAGLILVHPFFGEDHGNPLWEYLCPGTDVDKDVRLDPGLDPGRLRIGLRGCGRILVCVGEKDFLKRKGEKYYELLKEESEWKGEIVKWVTKGKGHVFHLYKPQCDEAKELLKCVANFIGKSSSNL